MLQEFSEIYRQFQQSTGKHKFDIQGELIRFISRVRLPQNFGKYAMHILNWNPTTKDV